MDHEVDTVFGIPGIQLYDLVDALFDVREFISLIAPRHEQSTTYMADGYARVTGRPGVALVVPGPGMLNATAGLATALACSSPVLLICGQIDSSLMNDVRYGALHEIPNQTESLRHLTKWVGTALDAHEIPDLVTQAFHHMTTGVPGPVALEVPPDVLSAIAVARPTQHLVRPDHVLRTEQLEEIVAAIAESSYPYLLVGGGALSAGAGPAVIAFAEQLGCPVIQTRNGRGVVDASHPQVLDPYMRDLVLGRADLAIVLGSRMGSGAGGHIELGTDTVINVNADVSHLGYPRPTARYSVLGDAKQVTEQLVEGLKRYQAEYSSKWDLSELAEARAEAQKRLDDVDPQRGFLRAIRESLPENSVLVSEYTQVGYLASISYPATAPRSFVSPGYQGTLGYGFATAIGAQVGAGKRRVVSISGDGGFSWTLPELATLTRYGIPLIAIVFNDGRYGNVFRSQKYGYDNRIIGSELTNPDFGSLAQAYGIEFHSVDSPVDLAATLEGVGMGTPAPVLIEVVVGELPSAWHLFDEPGQ